MLSGTVEEESAENGDPHAVTQYRKIGLGELKCSWVLVHHLPNTVQEEQEQWRLKGTEQEIYKGACKGLPILRAAFMI